MDVIRMIKAAVQYKEVELKQDLDDAGMSRRRAMKMRALISSPLSLRG